MNGKQLRASILQEAIAGRLVPQDPNDEPASELLKKIRKEKEKLIKEGKLPKDKNETLIFRGDDKKFYEQKGKTVTCIDDQIPFEIPDSWEWAKLGQIARIRLGKTPPRSEAVFWSDGIFNWVAISDMADYGHVKTSKEKVSDASKALMGDLSPVGTLIMSFKLTVGRTSILEIPAYHNEAIISIFPYFDKSYALRNYLFYVLPLISNYGEAKNAIKGATLNKKSLEDLSIPIPPLAEQKRIVAKIEELMPLVDEYEKAQEEFDNLNAGLKNKLRTSLLQEAIAGRLVPQNSSDEPASELLKSIREEKARLVKEGKLPKDKNETLIFRGDDKKFYEQKGKTVTCIDDQIPFEIPDSWEWCRLGDIFSHCSGKALNKSNNKGTLRPYITTSNLYWNYFVLDNLRQMPFTKEELDKCTAVKGDLLVCEGGDVGRAAIWNYDEPICLQNHIHKLRAYVPLCTLFFYNVLYLYKHTGRIGGKGIALQGLSSRALHNIIIPLPPLAEQKRIVEKLESMFAVLDNLDACGD